MAIQAQDILEVADYLARSSSGKEAYVRSAVSRYYYSAFMTAKSLEARLHVPMATYDLGAHMRVINKFANYTGPEKQLVVKIGKELQRLKSLRSRADYEMTDTMPAQALNDCKRRAEQIIKWCETARTVLP